MVQYTVNDCCIESKVDAARYERAPEIVQSPVLDATQFVLVLSRFDSGSVTHLSGLLFEGQGAFPTQC